MNRVNEIEGSILFSGTQYFRVKWLWALLICCILLSVFLPIIIAIINNGDSKEAILSLLITVPLESFILYLFYIVRLETIVSKAGIYYRWYPFFKKYSFIQKNDIETAISDDGPVWMGA